MELPDLPPIGVWQTWKQTPEGDIHPFGKAYCFSGYGEGRTDIGIFYTYYKTGVNTAEVHSKDASREVGQRVRLDFKTPTAGVASVSSQARNSSSQFQGLRFKLTPINSNSPGETMHRLSRDEIRLPYDAEK